MVLATVSALIVSISKLLGAMYISRSKITNLTRKTLLLLVCLVVLSGGYFGFKTIFKRHTVRSLDADEKQGLISRNEEYQQANPLDSNSTPEQIYEYYFNNASTLSAIGKQDEAIAEFNKAASSGTKLSYSFYISLGLAYEIKGDFKTAKAKYEQALNEAQHDPNLIDDATKQSVFFSINENIERIK